MLYPSKSRFTETGWLGSYPHVWNEKIMGLLVCNPLALKKLRGIGKKIVISTSVNQYLFLTYFQIFLQIWGLLKMHTFPPDFESFFSFLFSVTIKQKLLLIFIFLRKGLIIDSSRLGYHQTDLRLGIVVHAKGTFGIWEQKWKWDGNVGELWTHKNKESKS